MVLIGEALGSEVILLLLLDLELVVDERLGLKLGLDHLAWNAHGFVMVFSLVVLLSDEASDDMVLISIAGLESTLWLVVQEGSILLVAGLDARELLFLVLAIPAKLGHAAGVAAEDSLLARHFGVVTRSELLRQLLHLPLLSDDLSSTGADERGLDQLLLPLGGRHLGGLLIPHVAKSRHSLPCYERIFHCSHRVGVLLHANSGHDWWSCSWLRALSRHGLLSHNICGLAPVVCEKKVKKNNYLLDLNGSASSRLSHSSPTWMPLSGFMALDTAAASSR